MIFETHFNMLVSPGLTHTISILLRGPDDMTSHIKSNLLGNSVSFPIKNGVPLLGTWQGIYLCEHRNRNWEKKNSYYKLWRG